jgi:hypothetical protein
MLSRDLIREGIDLIETSQLARWEGRFISQDKIVFDAYWRGMHPRYGRWFCWHAFGVGAENIIRGSYQVKKLPVNGFGPKQRWADLGVPTEDIEVLNDNIRLLATRRNEGAHRFIAGARDAYFPEVAEQYIPTLNLLLEVIGYQDVPVDE